MKAWDVETGKELLYLPNERGLAATADGKLLATGMLASAVAIRTARAAKSISR